MIDRAQLAGRHRLPAAKAVLGAHHSVRYGSEADVTRQVLVRFVPEPEIWQGSDRCRITPHASQAGSPCAIDNFPLFGRSAWRLHRRQQTPHQVRAHRVSIFGLRPGLD